jgi:serine/threonine protein kinase
VLLDEDGNIKLCDFGWSADDIKFKRTTYCGTLEYMAPEMISAQVYNLILFKPHDFRVDVWSVGVLLFELLHGFAPFS